MPGTKLAFQLTQTEITLQYQVGEHNPTEDSFLSDPARPRLAIFGATGAVGSIVCKLLAERQFPFQSIRFFGAPITRTTQSIDRQIEFGGRAYPVEPLVKERVADIDLVIASTPDEVARDVAPWVVDQGGIMIDESAAHRMLDHVPLVIPEVNPESLAKHSGIIASPNCSTTQMVVCLKPLLDAYGLKRVVVTTYQAASGAGNAARQELIDATRAVLDGNEFQNKQFESPLALNLWPKIGGIRDDGYTSEETKMVHETRKILGIADLPLCATCVRVPVENCHSESIVVETDRSFSIEDVCNLFENSPGIKVVDNPGQRRLPTPQNCDGRDEVFVGRIRRDPSVENGIAFWCVSDNLRKGAATNAVQIAELLVTARA
jgi:aspartate-semialdehyde dehydrogenase